MNQTCKTCGSKLTLWKVLSDETGKQYKVYRCTDLCEYNQWTKGETPQREIVESTFFILNKTNDKG